MYVCTCNAHDNVQTILQASSDNLTLLGHSDSTLYCEAWAIIITMCSEHYCYYAHTIIITMCTQHYYCVLTSLLL